MVARIFPSRRRRWHLTNTLFQRTIRRGVEIDELIEIIEQLFHWAEEYVRVKEGGKVDPSSAIYRLNPLLEHGIIEMRRRLEYSKLPEQVKFPIIIPKDSGLAHWLVLHEHNSDVNWKMRIHFWVLLREVFFL